MNIWYANILGILVPLLAGAVITYFSSPLTEKRLARIRTAEKITDKRIAAYDELWSFIIELDKTRSIHNRDHIADLVKVYPFLSSLLHEEVQALFLPKIFLSIDEFIEFSNRFSAVLTKSSVLLDDQTLKDFNALNVYLQVLIHYFAEMQAMLSSELKDSSNMEKFNEIFHTFVYDVGVICHIDLKLLSLNCEKCLLHYFDNPFVARKKRTISISDIDQVPFIQNSFFYANKSCIAENWIADFISQFEPQG